jgi:hypothetical protein
MASKCRKPLDEIRIGASGGIRTHENLFLRQARLPFTPQTHWCAERDSNPQAPRSKRGKSAIPIPAHALETRGFGVHREIRTRTHRPLEPVALPVCIGGHLERKDGFRTRISPRFGRILLLEDFRKAF